MPCPPPPAKAIVSFTETGLESKSGALHDEALRFFFLWSAMRYLRQSSPFSLTIWLLLGALPQAAAIKVERIEGKPDYYGMERCQWRLMGHRTGFEDRTERQQGRADGAKKGRQHQEKSDQ